MSTNNGNTWANTGLTFNPTISNGDTELGEIAIDPNSTLTNTIIYVTSKKKVYRYQGPSAATGPFNVIYNDNMQYGGPLWFISNVNTDVAVALNGTMYFANYLGLFKYVNGAVTKIMNYTIPPPFNSYAPNCMHTQPTCRQDINIEINTQEHIVLLINFTRVSQNANLQCRAYTLQAYLYKSTDNGTNWSIPKLTTAYHNLSSKYPILAVNPTNSNIIYTETGNRCMQKSIDFCTNYTSMNNTQNHADVRNVLVMNSTNQELYLCTDGGVAKSINGLDWVDITGSGLSITNFYGCGIFEADDKFIFAGAQDGSINYFNNASWYETNPFADNGDCMIQPNDKSIIFQEEQDAILRGILVGNDVQNNSTYSVGGGWMNPLIWNGNSPTEFFVGINKLYLGNGSGTNYNLTEIYNNSLHGDKKRISSVALSRNNPNVVYYSTDDYWSYFGAPTDDGIFKAVRIGTNWTIYPISNNLRTTINGLPNPVLTTPITDITVDPNNENRIWLSMGAFNMSNKVFYSSNGGTSWQNITYTGLPNLPCTAIAFHELSNDRIYVGTDNGIYYIDNTQSCWSKYAIGGPQCMINDIEINNCAGKLVVATFGRGLWEVPLVLNAETTIPTGSTTWNTSRTVANNIIVPNGATLNITGSNTVINIAKDVKLFIAQGGKINITDAKLTNLCGYTWGGIDVWGNSNLSQIQANQGTLITNNATIEHAVNAISVTKDGGINFNGGIVQATNTKFFNNKRSVEYIKYDFQNNIGYFDNCNFKTDLNYRHDATLISHISLWSISGLKIRGCNFETLNNWPYNSTTMNRVIGIVAVDASFNIGDYCNTSPCTNPIKTKFKGLHKAINTSLTSGGPRTFSVYNAIFEDNVFGIITTGHNAFNIRGNNFVIGKASVGTSAAPTQEGVSVLTGSLFTLDHNTFTPTFTLLAQPTTIGIRVNNLGGLANEIYKNTFTKSSTTNNNILYGNLANGNNRDALTQIGLQYKCNININNILSGFDFAVTELGIAKNQGTPTFPPRNKFSLGTNVTGSDFKNSATTGNINYYIYAAPFENPSNIFQVDKINPVDNSNFCPDHYDPNGGGGAIQLGLIGLESAYADAKTMISSKEIILNTKIDSGNTQFYLNIINGLNQNNANQIINSIDMISPWLSIQLALELFNKIEIIGTDVIKTILSNNSTLMNDIEIQRIAQENSLFSNLELQNLITNIDLNSERYLLEKSIEQLKITVTDICKSAIQYLSIYSFNVILEDWNIWLHRINSFEIELYYIDLCIFNGELTLASNLVDSLIYKNQSFNYNQQELNNFIFLKHFQLNILNQGRTILKDLNEAELGILRSLAYASGLAGDQIRAILNFYGDQYFVEPVFPNSNENFLQKLDTIINKNLQNSKIEASPNPTSGIVNFKYNLAVKLTKNMYLTIYNELGLNVVQMKIDSNIGEIIWDSNLQKEGIYYYCIIDEKTKIVPPKLLLVVKQK